MGCCENKRLKLKLFSKEVKIEQTDKKSQINILNGIMKKIENEIKEIKEGKNLKNHDEDKIKRRACYLSQLVIFINWSMKVIEVNQEDARIYEIVKKAEELLMKKEDEFMLHSLENKIKYILNNKIK